MAAVCLCNLFADAQHRVEGGHGFLEDHSDAAASDVLEFPFGQGKEVPPIKEGLPGGDPARRVGHQTQHAQGQHALAAAGLAHQGQGFSLLQGKACGIDRLGHPLGGGEAGGQAPNVQHGSIARRNGA